MLLQIAGIRQALMFPALFVWRWPPTGYIPEQDHIDVIHHLWLVNHSLQLQTCGT
jgi:hypothetical protein